MNARQICNTAGRCIAVVDTSRRGRSRRRVRRGRSCYRKSFSGSRTPVGPAIKLAGDRCAVAAPPAGVRMASWWRVARNVPRNATRIAYNRMESGGNRWHGFGGEGGHAAFPPAKMDRTIDVAPAVLARASGLHAGSAAGCFRFRRAPDERIFRLQSTVIPCARLIPGSDASLGPNRPDPPITQI